MPQSIDDKGVHSESVLPPRRLRTARRRIALNLPVALEPRRRRVGISRDAVPRDRGGELLRTRVCLKGGGVGGYVDGLIATATPTPSQIMTNDVFDRFLDDSTHALAAAWVAAGGQQFDDVEDLNGLN